jgi:hypothetical protein
MSNSVTDFSQPLSGSATAGNYWYAHVHDLLQRIGVLFTPALTLHTNDEIYEHNDSLTKQNASQQSISAQHKKTYLGAMLTTQAHS